MAGRGTYQPKRRRGEQAAEGGGGQERRWSGAEMIARAIAGEIIAIECSAMRQKIYNSLKYAFSG